MGKQLIHHNGQTLIEFAVVLPAIAILLLGVMAVGRFLFTLHDVSSHTRGLHKNSMRYASSNNVADLIRSDLGADYNIRIRGASKHAMVVQASKQFEPFGNLLPSINISGSTSMPAMIMADVTGNSLTDGANYSSNPDGAIALAKTFNFQAAANCPEEGYCIGTNLDDPAQTPNEFYHFPSVDPDEAQPINLPTVIPFTNGIACEVDVSAMTTDEFSYQANNTTNTVQIHPICSDSEGNVDAECQTKKNTNMMVYLNEHINLIEDNGGCNGEETY